MYYYILNKSWQQHPTRHQLCGHLSSIAKTIQARRTRHEGNCRKSKNELISDVFLWTPAHGKAKAGRLARKYICYILTFDPVQKCYSKVIHRKEVTHSNGQ